MHLGFDFKGCTLFSQRRALSNTIMTKICILLTL